MKRVRVVGALSVGSLALLIAIMLYFSPWSSLSPDAKVVEAASNTEAYYQNNVDSFRFSRQFTWGPTSWPVPGGEEVDVVLEKFDEVEVVYPNRRRISTRKYDVLINGDPDRWVHRGQTRAALTGCPGASEVTEVIVVGPAHYTSQCDGSWRVNTFESPQGPARGFGTGLEEEWDNIKNLTEVAKVGADVVRGVETDVFEGSFLDQEDKTRQVTVWIGTEDNLIRRFRMVWPQYFVVIEHYDFNDPSITIEPPVQ